MSVINNLPQGGGGNIIKDLAKMSTFTQLSASSEQSTTTITTMRLSDGTTFFTKTSAAPLYLSGAKLEAATQVSSITLCKYMVETENYALFSNSSIANGACCYDKRTKTATAISYVDVASLNAVKGYVFAAVEDTDGLWVLIRYTNKSSSGQQFALYWCDLSANTIKQIKQVHNSTSDWQSGTLLMKTQTGVIAAALSSIVHIRKSDMSAVTNTDTNIGDYYYYKLLACGNGKYIIGQTYEYSGSGNKTAYIATVDANTHNITVDSSNTGNILAMLETANYYYYGIGKFTSASSASTYTATMHRVSKSTGTDETLSYKASCAYEVDDGWILYGNYNAIYFMDKATETVTQISDAATIMSYDSANTWIKLNSGDCVIYSRGTWLHYSATEHTITLLYQYSTTSSARQPFAISKDGQYLYVPIITTDNAYAISKHHISDMTQIATYTMPYSSNVYFMYATDDGYVIYVDSSYTYAIDTNGNVWRIYDKGVYKGNAYRKGDIIVIRAISGSSSQTPTLLINTKTLKCSYDESGEVWTDAIEKQAELIYTNE